MLSGAGAVHMCEGWWGTAMYGAHAYGALACICIMGSGGTKSGTAGMVGSGMRGSAWVHMPGSGKLTLGWFRALGMGRATLPETSDCRGDKKSSKVWATGGKSRGSVISGRLASGEVVLAGRVLAGRGALSSQS